MTTRAQRAAAKRKAEAEVNPKGQLKTKGQLPSKQPFKKYLVPASQQSSGHNSKTH